MKYIVTSLFVLCSFISIAQNDYLKIGSVSNEPSAQFEVSSTEKGMLIPRMRNIERNSISSPAQGLLVFDNDTSSFWYFDGINWIELGNYSFSYLQDADGDTHISLEKNVDEDIFRFKAEGLEIATLDNFDFKLLYNADLLCGNAMAGSGKKLFFDNSKNAFRAGSVNGTLWDANNIGNNSVAFGENNIAQGDRSAAWGENNSSPRSNTTTWGKNNTASGNSASLSFGEANRSIADYSSSWGLNNEATGAQSTAWGSITLASGSSSTAFGFSTKATEKDATAWGTGSEAQALGSTAFGFFAFAKGDYSTSFGEYTNAESYAETTVGRYNANSNPISRTDWNISDLLFVVGNGTSQNNRRNAFEIYKNGNVRSYGDIAVLQQNNNQEGLNFSEAAGPKYSIRLGQFGDVIGFHRTLANGSETPVMSWDQFGQIVIGSGFLTTDFNVWGQASKNSSGGWLANSDERLKKNMNTIDPSYAMQQIMKMKGVSYEWDDKATKVKRPTGKQHGFIAQDLLELWPKQVKKDKNGFYMTAYGEYDPMFVSSFKAQQAQIAILQDEHDSLHHESLQIRNRYNQIKQHIKRLQYESSILIQEVQKMDDKHSSMTYLNNLKTIQQ